MNISSGSRGILIHAAYLKYILATLKLSDAERLETLEQLASLHFSDVTAEAIATVEPCSHEVARMIGDALDMPPAQPNHKISAGWALLARNPTWSRLVALNPSLGRAMELCRWVRTEAAA
jgi:hypothetical protein